MFRFAKPGFRLHKAACSRKAARASREQGVAIWISEAFFPGEAAGLAPAAFLLDRADASRSVRRGRELCSGPENYGALPVAGSQDRGLLPS